MSTSLKKWPIYSKMGGGHFCRIGLTLILASIFPSSLLAQSDTTPPTVSSATVDGTTLVVTFDEVLASVTGLTNSAFTVKKTPDGGVEESQTLSGTPGVSERTVTLTLTSAAVASDMATVKVSYTAPDAVNAKLRDAADNAVVNFTNEKVINLSAGVCSRTPELRDTIVEAVAGKTYCDEITSADLSSIESLSLGGNQISRPEIDLDSHSFDGLTNLTELTFFWCSLRSLPGNVFDNLTGLTELSIRNCGLSSLPSGVFDELTGLTNLTIEGSSISSLPGGVFDELVGLTELTIQDSGLSSLPDGVFDELTNLEKINLATNDLTNLDADLFDGLTQLSDIRISGNLLTSVPENLFDGLIALERIYLSARGGTYTEKLTSLPENLLDGLAKLRFLFLAGQDLTTLPKDLFDDVEVEITVDLSGNPLDCIPGKILQLDNVTIEAFLSEVVACIEPAVTLSTEPSSVEEEGEATDVTVTATLNVIQTTATTVTVSVESGTATSGTDFTEVSDFSITIPANTLSATGTFILTPTSDTVDEPDETVLITGTTAVEDVTVTGTSLTITDDDGEPTVTLELDPTSIGENREMTTVTATLDRPSSQETTITISAEADAPATDSDYTLSTNTTLTIAAGATTSTGTVTITASDNEVDAPDKRVQVKGTATNTHGIIQPDEVELIITDDDGEPTVTLELDPTSIGENGEMTTVTATLDRPSSQETTITISAEADAPATDSDYTLSTNTTLTIATGATTSTGTVTITASDNEVDAPDKRVQVKGAATNTHGIIQPDEVELIITDDDGEPTVTLELDPTSIGEDGESTTVTATLDRPSSQETTITISAEADAPATDSDYTLSTNTILTIAAGATTSTGTVTITASDNEVDAPDKRVQVKGAATNTHGIIQPDEVELIITDDDGEPTVTLELDPTSIGENGEMTTVTATLDRPSSQETTITISAEADAPATDSDYTLSTNTTLTIATGATTSTGTVTITASDNEVDAPDKRVQVKGAATNTHGIIQPDEVELIITDDDGEPTVTLELDPTSIGEDGESTTVTATLDRPSSQETTITISAEADAPATDSDYTLSTNTILTIAAGATTSTGTVTITASDNEVDAPDKRVQVKGAATNTHGIIQPDEVELIITDDDGEPTVTLELDPPSISEDGESTTVTATLDRPSSQETIVAISAEADSPATGADYVLSDNKMLIIAAGAISRSEIVTITARNNQIDEPDKKVTVTGNATNTQGITQPDNEKLTITDDEDMPTVTLLLSSSLIGEEGESTSVTATLNRASSEETTVTISAEAIPPASDTDYELIGNTTLTIAAGETTSTGTVTITSVDDEADTPDKVVTVKGEATNPQGITQPEDVELTITDGTAPPAVTLRLSATSISENEVSTTVTATLNRASSEETIITISAEVIPPTEYADFTLSANTTLTIAAGAISSTGTVTITAVDNQVDAPDKMVTVIGEATNAQGITQPANMELTINDDDVAPMVTLVLTPNSISENGESAAVSATLDRPSSEETIVTISIEAVPPATESDYELTPIQNVRLTIVAGATTSTGTVTIVAVDNEFYAPEKKLTVKGEAMNSQGITQPAIAELTITDDDLAPTVTLRLSPPSISENAGVTTVTATLNRASVEETSITVSVLPDAPAQASDLVLSGNTILTIAAGETTSTGTVTITAVNNETDAPDKTVQVQGVVLGALGMANPAAATLIITDDDGAASVTLYLSPPSISENAGRTTVTATLSRPSGAVTSIDVSALPDAPAQASDLMMSQNTVLTIEAGDTKSTGLVTITAVDNEVSTADKTVQVQGVATNAQGVTGPAAVTLSITDDDVTPNVTLILTPPSISESAGRTMVTARLDHPSTAVTTVTVSVTPIAPATATDFTLSANTTLTIAVGSTISEGVVTITAVDNTVSEADKTVQVQGVATNAHGVTGPAALPQLTISDDDGAPKAMLALDPASISENGGRAAVMATLDRPSSAVTTIMVMALVDAPATASDITLSANLTLTIVANATTSTGLVTITAVDNEVDAPDKTVKVRGIATNAQGIIEPMDVELRITDDDGTPTVTLALDPATISENGGQTTVTATLNRPSSTVTTITVSAVADAPATVSEYRLSTNQTLTIGAGDTESTGEVTITAVDNEIDGPDKTVQVKGMATNTQGITNPSEVVLTITDDEAAPTAVLTVDPAFISENGGMTTVTATLDRPSSDLTMITVTALADPPAKASDITLSANPTLTIAANAITSTGLVTITAVDNEVDAPNKTVQVQGLATNTQGVMGPTAVLLTLTDDDESLPEARDVTIITEEDTPYRFGISDFGYSDPDGDPLAAVRIDRHPDAGILTLGGAEFPAGKLIMAVQISAGELVFTPALNAYGPAYTSFDFKVSNGKSESPLAAVMTVDVTPTNDVATGRLQIIGSMQVGQELRVSVEEILDLDGILRAQAGESDYAFRYHWLRMDQSEPIAEGRTYIPTENDAGASLVARVAFVDDAGFEEILESPPRQVRYTSRIRTAWMGRLGRTVADQVLHATQCDGRIQRPRRSEAYLAGQPLRLASLPNYVRLQEVKPDRPSILLGDSDPTYRLGHTLTRERLFHGSSFRHMAQSGSGVAIWGRGAMSRIRGADGALNLEGHVQSWMMGVDLIGDRGGLGVLVSHSRSEGEHAVATDEGTLSGDLIGIYPNACYALTSGMTTWAVAGIGRGSMTVERVSGRIEMQMVGGGIYGRIRSVPERGLELGIRSDALMVQMSASATEELPEDRTQVTRLRLGLQGMIRGIRLGARSTIEPLAEVALRHDGGDAETGFGIDLRVGIVFLAPASGLSMEVSARSVLTHQDRILQEQGVAGMVTWDTRPQSREGFEIRLEHTIGTDALGQTERFLHSEAIQPRYTSHSPDYPAGDIRLQAGYGFVLFSKEVTLQPEVSFSGWGPQRRYEMGWNITRARERRTNVQLFVGATGQAPRNHDLLQLRPRIHLKLRRQL